jgi:hypothetical protein
MLVFKDDLKITQHIVFTKSSKKLLLMNWRQITIPPKALNPSDIHLLGDKY